MTLTNTSLVKVVRKLSYNLTYRRTMEEEQFLWGELAQAGSAPAP